jgi:hypothetical protein
VGGESWAAGGLEITEVTLLRREATVEAGDNADFKIKHRIKLKKQRVLVMTYIIL